MHQPDNDLDQDPYYFAIHAFDGTPLLEGTANTYAALNEYVRREANKYPAASIWLENDITGHALMFAPEAPHVAVIIQDTGFIVGITATIEYPSDWQVWAWLTSNGQFDPAAKVVDFLGDGQQLARVQLQDYPNLLLN